MYYVTTDCLLSEGECILEDAEIVEYKTLSKARDHLLDSFAEVEEGYEIVIEPGQFDKCWKRTPLNGIARVDIDPFCWDEVYIQHPEKHPGDSTYWITPGPEVLVAKLVSTTTPSKEGIMYLNITSTTVGPLEDGSFRAGVRVEMSDQTSFVYSRQGPFPTKDEASRIAQAFLQYVCELIDKALVEVKYEKLIELPCSDRPRS